jgi:hypothetical protein
MWPPSSCAGRTRDQKRPRDGVGRRRPRGGRSQHAGVLEARVARRPHAPAGTVLQCGVRGAHPRLGRRGTCTSIPTATCLRCDEARAPHTAVSPPPPTCRARRCARSGRGACWGCSWPWRLSKPRRYSHPDPVHTHCSLAVSSRKPTTTTCSSCCAPVATRCSRAPSSRGTMATTATPPYPHQYPDQE